ncbi:MAG: T9SS type A sorting domain-containing protein [Bacteroidota bacterium]
MKYAIYTLFLWISLFASTRLQAQDLRINRIDNVPDTSLFSTVNTCQLYYQYAGTALSVPFTVYFNYSVNGIVQNEPLDSFVYSSAITTELSRTISIPTNNPVYRKGDNIVVVWPICNQATHTANYYRKEIFVTDSLHHTAIENLAEQGTTWNTIFDNTTKKIVLTTSEALDFPVQLKVYDASGKMLHNEKMNQASSSSIQDLNQGIYFFELRNKNKKSSGRFLVY